MAANVRTEMRIPTRAAPRPPGHSATMQRDSLWSSSNDIFGSSSLTAQPPQKKKPPPRPPPPKFNQNHTQYQIRDQKPRKPARPTELLTNFFGRRKQENAPPSRSICGQSQQNLLSQPAVSLIDLSPPGSPTFTTRSSSDGVSVDSFGSDGNSNPSVFTSSGNTSQTDSAFEDDFDFFGLSARRATAQNDPWQQAKSSVQAATAPQQQQQQQDPFGPLEDTRSNVLPLNSNGRVATANRQVPSIPKPLVVASMPTIIRARPPKPPAPKILAKKLAPSATIEARGSGATSKPLLTLDLQVSGSGTANGPLTLDFPNDAWSSNDCSEDSPSPPMPSIPPPALPADYLTEWNGDLEGDDSDKPHGIALYDFPATHPDDLALKDGDFVHLLRQINDDWLEGRVGDRRGMFPISFVDIKVPLPGLADNAVTALYAFQGENGDDLSFEEGAKIIVISRISQDWMYGEYNGRRGQFPANHVNRLPRNI